MMHVDHQGSKKIEAQLHKEFLETLQDETVGPLLPLFTEHFFDRMRSLKHSLDVRDTIGALRLAHQSKGAAAMYGFRTIQNFFSALEHEVQEAQHPISETIVNNLVAQIDVIETIYQRVSSELQSKMV